MHGANRLGGNSLSDLLVFGRRAGLGAAEYAKRQSGFATLDERQIEAAAREMTEPFEREGGENPFLVQQALQEAMQTYVGIFRNADDLHTGLGMIREIIERAKTVRVEGSRMYNPGWHLARDLHHMLRVSEAIALSADLRKESRGAHSRTDFPNLDAEAGKMTSTVRRAADGTMTVVPVPLPPLPEEMTKILAEQKELQPAREEANKQRIAAAGKE
jgi:succinate dehydrogenase / fumarate reductase flavoprotein subunit